MSDALPPCPACGEAYTYEDRGLYVCPMCAHEWTAGSAEEPAEAAAAVIKASVGNVLADGDTVPIAKDVKVTGAGGGVMYDDDAVSFRSALASPSRKTPVTSIQGQQPSAKLVR